MSKFKRPTLEDIYGAGQVATEQAVEARKFRRPTLAQLYGEKAPEELPFAEGSTLQATVPLPGEWPTADTGIPLSPAVARFLAGAGKRFSDIGLRGRQLTGQATSEEGAAARERDRPLMETTAGLMGNMAPDMLAGLLVPGGYGAGAGLGAAQGLSMPTVTDDPLGETGMNVLSGTGGAVLGTALGRKAAALLGKIPHAAPGMIPAGVRDAATRRGINLPEPQWEDPAKLALARTAQAEGVPLSIGDLDPASKWVQAEKILEHLPSNRRQFMAEQRDANKAMVDRLKASFGTSSKGKEGADIMEGLREQYRANRQMSSHLFDNVKLIAKGSNPGPIRPANTYQAAKDAAAEYPDLFDDFKNAPFMRKLLGLEKDMGPQAGLIVNPKTGQPFKYDQKLTFEEAQFARKRLGEWYAKLKTQASKGTMPQGLDRSALPQAAKIFKAFDDDLDAWASQPGNDALNEAWRGARKYHAEHVVPYTNPAELGSKSPIVRDIVEDRVDPATIVDRVLPTRETGIARDVMELASPKGQSATKAALVDRMTEGTTGPDLQGMDNAALLRHTNRFGHSGEAVFSPAEQAQLGAVRDVARATQRSQVDPTQSSNLFSTIMGGSAIGSLPFAAMHAASAISPESTSADKAWASFMLLPAMAAIAGRGAQGYSASQLGKNMRFADPVLQGAGGALQRFIRQMSMGAGQPTEEAFRQGNIGHRGEEDWRQ